MFLLLYFFLQKKHTQREKQKLEIHLQMLSISGKFIAIPSIHMLWAWQKTNLIFVLVAAHTSLLSIDKLTSVLISSPSSRLSIVVSVGDCWVVVVLVTGEEVVLNFCRGGLKGCCCCCVSSWGDAVDVDVFIDGCEDVDVEAFFSAVIATWNSFSIVCCTNFQYSKKLNG